VVLVNEALARRAWPNGDAVGSRIRLGGTADSVWRTVIGVARDVRSAGLTAEPRTELYLPHAQFPAFGAPQRNMVLVARGAGDPAALAAAVRREVRALDPTLPLSSVRTMDDVLGRWLAERRLSLIVLTALGVAALALAALGVYGVMAYSVAQRTQEIGVRMALGAEPRAVLAMVLRQGGGLALAGLAVGVVAALALTRLMATMLFETSATDPATFVGIAVLLAAIALVATLVPAARATRVPPVVALRAE
jgi:putative ABC transport system permease protein